jgi:D-alanyl-lipoteichoic acid acyltransferase DltB (MBOAT superfamily)
LSGSRIGAALTLRSDLQTTGIPGFLLPLDGWRTIEGRLARDPSRHTWPMLFHSQTFIFVFLPLVLLLYYRFAGRARVRIGFLVFASFVFYGYWEIRLVPLLAASIVVNWLFARVAHLGKGRWPVAAGVALNLIVLGIFKYADFFADSLAALGAFDHARWNIILPLGISFFTFQQISYLIDLRRGAAPLYRFDEYALYVSFFPQLIAGPIVRHNEIIDQFAFSPLRDGMHERLARGLVLFLVGIVKKAILADRLAMFVDPIYARAEAGGALAMPDAWLAAGGFGLQIYFDFSGYSDMAIGLALMFGFVLPENFNAPYRATSIRAFWRRWHMTLSRFLRDYLYIPLGGSRHGWLRQGAAVMITMLLGGLWHGAGWTFVSWGGLHGLALAANQLWRRSGMAMPAALGWLLTMGFVFFCWILFRAETFGGAARLIEAFAGPLTGPALHPKHWVLLGIASAVALLGITSQRLVKEHLRPYPALGAGLAVGLAYMALHVGGKGAQEFIYFQF